ncbi:MAG: hypothetical protein WC364_01595 [Eubacteriales bacterium]|jgi:hypothetical protein
MQYGCDPEDNRRKECHCNLKVRDYIIVIVCGEIEIGKLKNFIEEALEAKQKKSTCQEC